MGLIIGWDGSETLRPGKDSEPIRHSNLKAKHHIRHDSGHFESNQASEFTSRRTSSPGGPEARLRQYGHALLREKTRCIKCGTQTLSDGGGIVEQTKTMLKKDGVLLSAPWAAANH